MRLEKKYYYMVPYITSDPFTIGFMEIVANSPLNSYEQIEGVLETMKKKRNNNTLMISGAPFLMTVDKCWRWK